MATLLSRLSRAELLRVVRDIFVDELQAGRGRAFDPSRITWREALTLEPEGLDCDSFERFSLAGRLNDFFGLYESGVEDNLLRARTLGDTLDVIETGIRLSSQYLNFRSGGTIGTSRSVRQDLAWLTQEVTYLAAFFAGRQRVVVTVPVHHIFGFLYGVLLPTALDAAVVDARWSMLGGSRRPGELDLVVAVPFLWDRLVPAVASWGAGVWGVSSTASLSRTTAETLTDSGLERLIEVYGSSETGGIGWRDHTAAGETPFMLFPFWDRGVQENRLYRRSPVDTTSHAVDLPDRVQWTGERTLYPRGRTDAVVQVGGHNVDLEALQGRIVSVLPEVRECAVRFDPARERLRAFLVVSPEHANLADYAVTVRRRLRDHLSDHEIPVEITRGEVLPHTALGKRADW